jgi:hypothetical protein
MLYSITAEIHGTVSHVLDLSEADEREYMAAILDNHDRLANPHMARLDIVQHLLRHGTLLFNSRLDISMRRLTPQEALCHGD